MAVNLPFLPDKRSGCEGEVRSVLRAVFRDRVTRLPQVADRRGCGRGAGDEALPPVGERALRKARGKQLAHARADPLPVVDSLFLRRTDLSRFPPCGADKWMKNTFRSESSGEMSGVGLNGHGVSVCATAPASAARAWAGSEGQSSKSVSVGVPLVKYVRTQGTPAHFRNTPDIIVCEPPFIEFVNYERGFMYTVPVRLVNMSARDAVVSLRPPARRELTVRLHGALRVLAGFPLRLDVMFAPTDARAIYDTLLVRIPDGNCLHVPIACYIQPPILYVSLGTKCTGEFACKEPCRCEWCSPMTMAQSEWERTARALTLDLGARLLGDEHYSDLRLCSAIEYENVQFFVVTEDAWNSQDLTELTLSASVVCEEFALSPAWWRGGGGVEGRVWCRAAHAGLHAADLRVLCSSAVTRPLTLLADALYFYPHLVTLQAQEKYYDVCSEDDPDCEHYVHLGTSFPHTELTSTIMLINDSALTYSYYWTTRVWGKCTCGPEAGCVRSCSFSSSEVQVSASSDSAGEAAAAAVRAVPAGGVAPPRSSHLVTVAVPDTGERYGIQRAVLILVLKDIPRKSFPPGYYPLIMSTSTVPGVDIPGSKRVDRVVHDVVVCQLEVWWHVTPVQFNLDPSLLILPHSRRVSSVELELRVTQLFVGGAVRVRWRATPPLVQLPPDSELDASQPSATLTVHLLDLPGDQPDADILITAEEELGRWASRAVVRRRCAVRYPTLVPPVVWLGVVPPLTQLHQMLHVVNDTMEDIYWRVDVYHWQNERWQIEEVEPSCSLIQPLRGALGRDCRTCLHYATTAPYEEGVLATLVRLRRVGSDADAGPPPYAPPVTAHSSLIFCRVQRPVVSIQFLPCQGDIPESAGYALAAEEAAAARAGGAVLRPASALVVGRRACYRMLLTNHTPVDTILQWQPLDSDFEKKLRVMFIPETVTILGNTQIEVKVALEPRAVCGRQLWARKATILHASSLYMLVDTFITGIEVDFWLPLVDMSFRMTLKQRECFPWHPKLPQTVAEAFAWADAKRAALFENLCYCNYPIRYESPTHLEQETVVSRPLMPVFQPLAIEVRQLPINTVRIVRIRIRNVSVLTARWTAAMRLGAREPRRPLASLSGEAWSQRVRGCGLATAVRPSTGLLGSRAVMDLQLSFYADTWGVYRDQILILVEKLEPLVVNVWVEAVGSPLHFPLRPAAPAEPAASVECPYSDQPPTLWLSDADPSHTLRVRNTSRASLLLQAYMLRDHECVQDRYPFRLCMRMVELAVSSYDSQKLSMSVEDENNLDPSSATSNSQSQLTETVFELYLAPDLGVEDTDYLQVCPSEQVVGAGAEAAWTVSARAAEPPPHSLVVRVRPTDTTGDWWYRGEVAESVVLVRCMARAGTLEVSHNTLRIHISALELPTGDILRVRKRIYVKNTGEGWLLVSARICNDAKGKPAAAAVVEEAAEVDESTNSTQMAPPPSKASSQKVEAAGGASVGWTLVEGDTKCKCWFQCPPGFKEPVRCDQLDLSIPPRQHMELPVEVSLSGRGVWPDGWKPAADDHPNTHPPVYDQRRTFTAHLKFFDDYSILKSVCLSLVVLYPQLVVTPPHLTFGYVADGDVRKSYFSVRHTSRIESIPLVVKWLGGPEVQLHPTEFQLAPDSQNLVYVKYTAQYKRGAVCEGWAVVRAGGEAGEWCCAAVYVSMRATRDLKCHAPLHDHTDDTTLLPQYTHSHRPRLVATTNPP